MHLKICFLIPDFADGGAQKQCIYLINELQKFSDIEVHLINARDGIHDALLETSKLTLHRIPYKSNYDIRAALFVSRIIRKIQADIVFSWLQAADIQAFFAKKMNPNCKWILAQRNSQHPNNWRFKLRKLLGRKADAIISNSLAGDKYWGQAGANGLRYIVGNILYEETHPTYIESCFSDEIKKVVYVGRLEEQKNILNVCLAFCLLAKRRDDVQFDIVGQGSLFRVLELTIKAHEAKERVKLRGFRNDVKEIIKNSDLLVSLSLREGLPNTLIEAASLNKRILASNIPEHREFLGQSYPYLVSDFLEPEKISTCIEFALDNPDESTDCLSYSKALLAKMKPKTITSEYMRIFKEVTGNK